MPRKIASRKTRVARIRKGYLASGRKSIKNTIKLFKGTRTEAIASKGAAAAIAGGKKKR